MFKVITPKNSADNSITGLVIFLVGPILDAPKDFYPMVLKRLEELACAKEINLTVITAWVEDLEHSDENLREYYLENHDWIQGQFESALQQSVVLFCFPERVSTTVEKYALVAERQLGVALYSHRLQASRVVLYAELGYEFDHYLQKDLEKSNLVACNRTVAKTCDVAITLVRRQAHGYTRFVVDYYNSPETSSLQDSEEEMTVGSNKTIED